MTLKSTFIPEIGKARDKRKPFRTLCLYLGAVALLFGAAGFACEKLLGPAVCSASKLIALTAFMIAVPILTLLLSGYADGHARRGAGSTVVHIALFAELAVLLLSLGISGSTALNRYTQSSRIPAKAALYADKEMGVEGMLKPDFVTITGDEKGIGNKVFSGIRKSVNTAISDGLLAEADERALLTEAVNAYTERAAEKFPDHAEALKDFTEDKLPSLLEELTARAEEAAAGITVSSVRSDMNPRSTENYMLMYYATALIAIGSACAALALLLLVLFLTHDDEGRARIGERIEPFDYLLPFLVGVGVFTLYPMVRVLIMSFQEKYRITSNGAGTFTQWGLGNYEFVLNGNYSVQFLRGLKNTALYVLFSVPITAAIAIVIAYLLNQKTKLSALFQTAYFLPMVTTATAVGLVWRWMFNTNVGLINSMISFFTQFFGAPENINWLMTGTTNHTIPMTVLIIFGIWNSLPFTVILLLSGLQNIDENLYTVARVDGSGGFRIFFRITVPLLSPTIGLVLIINSISAFKVYTDVFVLWSGKPENYGMETVTWFIYNNIITSDGTHSLGYAAAAAMILFVIIFIFTMIQKFIQRKWVYQ